MPDVMERVDRSRVVATYGRYNSPGEFAKAE